MPTDSSAPRRWKCICAYDGSGFSGWQSQVDKNAVQDVIEKRLAEIVGAPCRIHGSGRTDAGVHALNQVFHFDAIWRHDPAKLAAALRTGLPAAIQIKQVRPAPASFHARFQATGKRYVYRICLGDADPFQRAYCWSVFRDLDLTAMRAAAEVLTGRHDFRAFTAFNGAPRDDTVRDLRRLEIKMRGRWLTVTAESNGFLYKMVRSLVGVLVAVGEGRLGVVDVKSLLAAHQRTPAVQTAPAHGLFLAKVFYARRADGNVARSEELADAEIE